MCCSVLQRNAVGYSVPLSTTFEGFVCRTALQCVAVCCSALQCTSETVFEEYHWGYLAMLFMMINNDKQ